MRILITGGAGFIGLNLAQHLGSLGHETVVLDRFSDQSNSMDNALSIADEVFELDLLDNNFDEVVESVDYVFNLAAESHNDRSLAHPAQFFHNNVMSTVNLVISCQKFQKRMHHVSTDEVFGDTSLDSRHRFDEDSSYRPSSPYSASKAASDHAVAAWIRSFGLAGSISYSSNNFGPYQNVEKFIPKTVYSVCKGVRPEIYGSGENIREWMHVEDHCRGLARVITHGKIGGRYFFSSGVERTNRDILHHILDRHNTPRSFYKTVVDRPGHDQRYGMNTDRTRRELNWEPARPDAFEDALNETIDWYRLQFGHDGTRN